MAYPRFYINEFPSGDKAVLDKDQSRHLVKVLRIKAGDRVELFDKTGNTYEAEIISSGESVQLKILNKRITSAKGGSASGGHNSNFITSITLATAIPKGNRMDWLVEKCAELGLNKLIPMETKRSVVKDCGQAKINRWKKIAIESNKQCHQQYLMEIAEILPFSKIIGSIENYDIKLLASPEGEILNRGLRGLNGLNQSNPDNQRFKIIYLIGPEGDFTPDEVIEAEKAGFKAVQMPVGGILRVETAAVTMLAMLKYLTADLTD